MQIQMRMYCEYTGRTNREYTVNRMMYQQRMYCENKGRINRECIVSRRDEVLKKNKEYTCQYDDWPK